MRVSAPTPQAVRKALRESAAILLAVLISLVTYEYLRFREWRSDLRGRLASDGGHD